MLQLALLLVLSQPVTVAKVNNEWVVTETRTVAHVVERENVKATLCFKIIDTPNGPVQGATLVEVLPLKDKKLGIVTDTPGKYRLITFDSQFQQTIEDFTVGPAPGPGPVPTPGVKNVLILYQTEDVNPRLAKFLVDIRTTNYPNKQLFLFDPDTKDPQGQTPEWLRGWLAKATKFPVLFISSSTGQTLYQGDLPATVDEFKTLMEKY